jgi:hypothetical protein
MKISIHFTMPLMALLLTVILACQGVDGAENFTLSDEGLMMLHVGSYYRGARASVLAKQDTPGPGVEYEIYFPGTKPQNSNLEMVCSYDHNDPMVGTNIGKFDNFELKFTLISINGKTTADAGGSLAVGTKIGCDGNWGGYRPMCIGLGENQEANAVSSTGPDGEVISNIGFTVYIFDQNGWDPNGSTIKILVEPVSGDVALPETKIRPAKEKPTRCIYVDADATGADDGSSWANAFKFLQDALAVASRGDQIWVAQGIYRPDRGKRNTPLDKRETFTLKTGVALYGGFPRGGGRLENGNPATYQTILSGDLKGNDVEANAPKELFSHSSRSDNSIHVITAGGTDETTVLDGFVITAGNTQSAERGYSSMESKPGIELLQGGGLYCKLGSPTVSNCIFKLNSAAFGGAVYFWRGNPELSNCKFIDNFAEDSGAGIYLSECNPTIVNCVFTKNSAVEKGGAIYNEFNKANVINCTITKNFAYAGGGVYNQKSTPTVTNCILWGNTSRYGTDEPAQLYGVKVEASNCCIQGMTEQLGGKNCFAQDPRIIDLGTDGYHLPAGSPCIDAGNTKAIPDYVGTDIDGNPRVTGTSVDIGACEYSK